MGLLNVPAGVSRVHASRRVFQHLAEANSDLAIVHHAAFPGAREVPQIGLVLQYELRYRTKCRLWDHECSQRCDTCISLTLFDFFVRGCGTYAGTAMTLSSVDAVTPLNGR